MYMGIIHLFPYKSKLTMQLLILMAGFLVHTQMTASSVTGYQDDTLSIVPFQGKIVDASAGNPVVFASVFVRGSSIGTVTNTDGEFLIKVPYGMTGGELGINHLAYQAVFVSISELQATDNLIKLERVPFPIEEVTIKNENPLSLIRAAKSKIGENYSTDPRMLTSFYRETIKKNRNYVAVSEAILDVYKSAYRSLDSDRITIYKGRRSQDVQRMDTVLFKLQGGPYISFMLDAVKHPGELLSEDFFNLYEYSMGGIVQINDQAAYIINFDQNDFVDAPLYMGSYYISTDDLAFVGIEFSISPKKIDQASEFLIRKKPLGMNIDVLAANYLIKYRKIDGLWYLNYVRSELKLRVRWRKKLFRSVYTTMSEMAVTDIDNENISKFKYRDTAKITDIFVDQLGDFEDPEFWGDYNIIKPEESIEVAIDRIMKRMEKEE